jgi:hypothetical protein
MKQKEINKHKKIALSDSDVLKLVEHKAKILIYSDLSKFKTLDEALGKHQAAFLLYESQPDYGHWTVLFRNDDYVEFFDPYGVFPDNELEWIPKHFREISGQMYPQLTALLYYSPYDLEYNEHKFQKHGEGINTCGRWSALRLAFRDVSLKQFAEMFKGKKSDDLVSILTSYDLEY